MLHGQCPLSRQHTPTNSPTDRSSWSPRCTHVTMNDRQMTDVLSNFRHAAAWDTVRTSILRYTWLAQPVLSICPAAWLLCIVVSAQILTSLCLSLSYDVTRHKIHSMWTDLAFYFSHGTCMTVTACSDLQPECWRVWFCDKTILNLQWHINAIHSFDMQYTKPLS